MAEPDGAEVNLTGVHHDVAADEAGQVQVNLDPGGAVEDEREARRFMALEVGRVDGGLDGGLGPGRDHAGTDPDVGAAALGPPVGDPDVGIGAVDHEEGVSDLGAAGDVAEIIGPLGEHAGQPIGLGTAGGAGGQARPEDPEQ